MKSVGILNCLNDFRINQAHIDSLEEINSNCTVEITPFNDPCYINICKRVRQCCTLPQKCSAAALELFFNHISWEHRVSRDGKQLMQSLSADDFMSCANGTCSTIRKINIWLKYKSHEIGLENTTQINALSV